MDNQPINIEGKTKKKKLKLSSINLNSVFKRLNNPSISPLSEEIYLKNQTSSYYNERILKCSK